MNFWHISNKTPNFVLMIELAQHIEVLLLENDCVIVPGFGGFVAYYTPAMRVEGNTFLPPTRTIGFNPQLKLNDGLLVQSYMAVYDTNFSDATKIVEEEVAELIAVLHKEGKVDLANVGELRYTIHGAYEFIPYENRITTPYLYGLDSFEMKELAVLHKPEEKVLIPVAAQERTKPYEIRINRAVLRNAVAMIAAIALFFAFSTPIENTAVEKDNYARLLPIDLFEKIENRSVVMTPVEVKQETKKSVTTAKISHGATSSEKETGKRAIPGDIVTMDGEVVGKHKGIIFYTVGQRKGLKLQNKNMYVCEINANKNQIVVCDNESLFKKIVVAHNVNMMAKESISGKQRAFAKIRYNHEGADCTVWMEDEKLYCEFDKPQRAVTPGQSLVVYQDGYVLCGGEIISE